MNRSFFLLFLSLLLMGFGQKICDDPDDCSESSDICAVQADGTLNCQCGTMPDCLTLYWDGKADKCDDSQCVCGTLNVKCNNGEQCVNGNCRGGVTAESETVTGTTLPAEATTAKRATISGCIDIYSTTCESIQTRPNFVLLCQSDSAYSRLCRKSCGLC